MALLFRRRTMASGWKFKGCSSNDGRFSVNQSNVYSDYFFLELLSSVFRFFFFNILLYFKFLKIFYLKVLLDMIHTKAAMEDIQVIYFSFILSVTVFTCQTLISYVGKWYCLVQKDLSPLVKQLAPAGNDNGAQIPYVHFFHRFFSL